MNRELLQQAIKGLAIQNVLLRSSRFDIAQAFNHRSTGELEVGAQISYGTKNSHIAQYKSPDQSSFNIFNAEVEMSIRLFDGKKAGTSPTVEEAGKYQIAELAVRFQAEYLVTSPDPIPEEAQREFAIHNVLYHVWPYWREYANSTFSRAGFPGVMIPMFVNAAAEKEENGKNK